MPASPLDGPPFRGRNAQTLQRIVDTVRSVLEPDVVDLEYVFEPQGQRYRWRMTGNQVTPLRTVRTAIRGGGPGVLSAPFAVPGLVRGRPGARARPAPPLDGTRDAAVRGPPPDARPAPRVRGGVRDPRRRPAAPRERRRCDTDSGLPRACLRRDPVRERGRRGARLRPRRRAARRVRGRPRDAAARLDPAAPASAPAGTKRRGTLADGRHFEASVARFTDEEEDVAVLTLRLLSTLSLEDVRTRLEERGVSGREAEVVGAVLEGLRNAEIARRLFITEWTVKDHLKHVFSQARRVLPRRPPARARRGSRLPSSGRARAGQTPAGGVPAPSHPQNVVVGPAERVVAWPRRSCFD